ncbi:MAG: hypothetical protein A2142_05305 [candidate division Zixibacteria bacterium RBG_16_48_11]|nr:MAG: hypothetical protein A2142_05305 [candidate division Zixibacteria bacterium RBG_16_48_11]
MVKIGRPYYELKVAVPSQFEESVSNFLIEAGSSGIKIDQNHSNCRLTGCFDDRDINSVLKNTKQYLEALVSLFPKKFSYQLGHQKREINDWSVKWRKSFKPVFLGKKIAVVPGWDKRKFAYPLVIRIYPQMAFGTGTHPTTQSCLLALSELVKPGDKVLDVGTGSGILTIAAAKLGAKSVTAIDVDRTITENAKENFKLNKVEKKIRLEIGGLDKVKSP